MIYAALAHLFAVMSPGPDTAIIIREVSFNKRKKLLNYLSKKNKSEYSDLIKKLNIRG